MTFSLIWGGGKSVTNYAKYLNDYPNLYTNWYNNYGYQNPSGITDFWKFMFKNIFPTYENDYVDYSNAFTVNCNYDIDLTLNNRENKILNLNKFMNDINGNVKLNIVGGIAKNDHHTFMGSIDSYDIIQRYYNMRNIDLDFTLIETSFRDGPDTAYPKICIFNVDTVNYNIHFPDNTELLSGSDMIYTDNTIMAVYFHEINLNISGATYIENEYVCPNVMLIGDSTTPYSNWADNILNINFGGAKLDVVTLFSSQNQYGIIHVGDHDYESKAKHLTINISKGNIMNFYNAQIKYDDLAKAYLSGVDIYLDLQGDSYYNINNYNGYFPGNMPSKRVHLKNVPSSLQSQFTDPIFDIVNVIE